MKESSMWSGTVRPALAGLDPVRVENPAHPGTPDVNYKEGWIELKFIAEWPKRANTIVRVPHFTPQQRSWLLRRSKAGGRVFMLMRVESDWLLFEGGLAAKIVGKVPRAGLEHFALKVWRKKLEAEELRECLRS